MKYKYPITAVLLLGASFIPGNRLAGMSGSLNIGGNLPPRSMNEILAQGFSVRKSSADKAWMDILQYCGGREFYLDRGQKLVRLANLATDLDPRFVYVYQFSGSMLMWQCNRPREAVDLLKKGIRNNPSERRLQLYLAAFTYYRLKDLSAQIATLEELVAMPDAPPMLYRILANVYMKRGDLQQAAKMWVFIAERSDDWSDREWAKGKLARYGIRVAR